MRIGVAAVDGVFTSGLAAILDILRTADALRKDVSDAIPAIQVTIHAPRATVRTAAGLTVRADASFAQLAESDIVLVSAFGEIEETTLLEQLRSSQSRALVRQLALLPDLLPVAAACTGSFALAEAGLLDQKNATTSWWLNGAFRSRYPAVRLDMDAMVVRDERVTTAGAAFGHLDLALDILRGISVTLADAAASFLVIDSRPAQSSYAVIGHMSAHDELVTAFERHVRTHLAEPANIDQVARAIGSSRRTLERRVRTAVGMSPLALIQRLRIEHARHLLATTDRSTDEIARTVGYQSASTLSTLLRRWPDRPHQ